MSFPFKSVFPSTTSHTRHIFPWVIFCYTYFMSYFPPNTSIITREPSPRTTSPIPSPHVTFSTRPTRPIMPGRISSWDSLDDRVQPENMPVAGINPHLPLDTFERLPNGTYRRVGSMSETLGPAVTIPEHDIHIPRYRIGWRTVVQIYGVCVAMATACIAAYNLYARTHHKPGFSANG